MKTKFTPGPWVKAKNVKFDITDAGNDWSEPAWCEIVDSNGMVTAIVPTFKMNCVEMEANRKLIARSPDMFKMLERVKSIIPHIVPTHEDVDIDALEYDIDMLIERAGRW